MMKRMLAVGMGMLALCWISTGFAQEAAPAHDEPGLEDVWNQEPVCRDECCGNDCCRRGGFIAGAGFYLMQPVWESNPAINFIVDETAGGRETVNTRIADFKYGVEFSPLVWIGYVGANGLGVRGRWWHFDASATEVAELASSSVASSVQSPVMLDFITGIVNTGGGTLTTESDIGITVFDVEAICELRTCLCHLRCAGGIRYAHVAQNFGAVASGQVGFDAGDPDFGPGVEVIRASHNFNGAGPTVALEAARRIGNRGGLGLYGNARGSLLFGSANENVYDDFVPGSGSATVFFTGTGSRAQTDILPILEAELGIEYRRPTSLGNLFVRLGINGQAWLGAGNAANSAPDAFRSEDGATLGFIGTTLSAGTEY